MTSRERAVASVFAITGWAIGCMANFGFGAVSFFVLVALLGTIWKDWTGRLKVSVVDQAPSQAVPPTVALPSYTPSYTDRPTSHTGRTSSVGRTTIRLNPQDVPADYRWVLADPMTPEEELKAWKGDS